MSDEVSEGAQGVAKAYRRPRLRLEERLFDALGEEWGGSANPPGDHLSIHIRDYEPDQFGRPVYYVAATSNDGFDLWLGKSYEWDTFMSASEARRLAWFILWRWWGRGTWFGLRRWIWYRLLHRRVRPYLTAMKRPAPSTPPREGSKGETK